MFDNLRITVSAFLMTLTVKVAPKELRPIMRTCLDAQKSITNSIRSGETGGIVINEWGITREGREIAQTVAGNVRSFASVMINDELKRRFELKRRYRELNDIADRPAIPAPTKAELAPFDPEKVGRDAFGYWTP